MTRLIFILISILISACSQSNSQPRNTPQLVGGPCEGCEAAFEYGDRDLLRSLDTLPDFDEGTQKIKVSGKIYENDGKTPAEGVILYVYHTDQQGLYSKKGDETGWAKRHGYNRRWIITDRDGNYSFYTIMPGIYPDSTAPAHIHPTILEPNGQYYWIESFHFEGDPLLSENEIEPSQPRGGSRGILQLKEEKGIWVGNRDIILGKNISGYK